MYTCIDYYAVASCYQCLDQYGLSIEFHERAAEIFKKHLPSQADGLGTGTFHYFQSHVIFVIFMVSDANASDYALTLCCCSYDWSG